MTVDSKYGLQLVLMLHLSCNGNSYNMHHFWHHSRRICAVPGYIFSSRTRGTLGIIMEAQNKVTAKPCSESLKSHGKGIHVTYVHGPRPLARPNNRPGY